MGWLRAARAIGGLLSVIALLGLIAADFWYPNRSLGGGMIALLVLLIGTLLAVDRLLQGQLVSIQLGFNDNDDNGEP